MNLAMYILVNEDIKISKGKLAGQVGHAVCSYMYHNYINVDLSDGDFKENIMEYKTKNDFLSNYMKQQKKIILKCPQSKLEELEYQGYHSIRDLGLTQLQPNTLTCINMGIYDRDLNEIPEFIKELKLYN